MAYQKLGRDSSARKALFRDLVTDLFLYERIQTTEAKAKELRSVAEKLEDTLTNGSSVGDSECRIFRHGIIRPARDRTESRSTNP